MRTNGISRRKFIAGTAAGFATVMVLPRSVWGANGKLNVASVGCAGKGGSDIGAIASSENIVALCDVHEGHAKETFKKFPDAKKFKDFRKMLDEMDKEIDAVTVSTPDHTHFPASMCAIMHGKHVFTQKPLTHNIWEARRLAQAVKEKKLASQMGIQGHAEEKARLLCEYIWGGVIGDVTEVHYYTNRAGNIWPQGIDRPRDTPKPPADIDWPLWLNVAPDRPYNGAYMPFRWRGWADFGCGAIGDIACHVMDAGFWALDLRYPSAVTAEHSGFNGETFPKWSIITFEFPARGKLKPVKVIWHDGGKMPPRPKDMPEKDNFYGECGAIFYGTKGTLEQDFYCQRARILGQSEVRQGTAPKLLPRAARGGTMGEFVLGCKSNGDAKGANYQYAAALTEMAHLGCLALRLKPGQKLEYDPKTMKVTSAPELNKYIKREPRKEYEIFYKGDDVLPMPTPINMGGMS